MVGLAESQRKLHSLPYRPAIKSLMTAATDVLMYGRVSAKEISSNSHVELTTCVYLNLLMDPPRYRLLDNTSGN